jgi:ATP-dependent DNA helicase RecQ
MAEADQQQLLSLLKRHFGFSEFRPLQEEIISAVMAGQDVFALLPTGGGKSLCYQLPALAGTGLTVVVSPLIALMKDQVDGLTAAGIPATFLNSSNSAGESRNRIEQLEGGRFKLLYVAPERLMISAFLEQLRRWSPRQIAIDEAHCISEWGHDFRPEYRQLAQLRKIFPGLPILALTATATERVRADIVQQLRLKEPKTFVGSFNRPNLSYTILEKTSPYEQLLELVSKRRNESGIVYCQSRKTAESLAARLSEDNIPALPYHAGLEQRDRVKNQEAFIRDNVRVICATIAFGMGINKPNVRFVIHHDLPKNIEGYYQETGRAGRDSLPSDCTLLFSAADVAKINRFIEDKPPNEREVARKQLDQMMDFAESTECRRAALLRYFGETYPEANCGSCDNCLNPKQTMDATVIAQKYLSCVYRIREKSGFPMGMGHVASVLMGKDLEKIRRFGHDKLSTYGIGKEIKAASWNSIGRELIRLGYLRQIPEIMNAVEMTADGMKALKARTPILLTTRPVKGKERRRESDDFDLDLFEELRALRKRLADERAVPAYVVFSDVTLRQIAREYPVDLESFGRVSGVGEKKRAEFGEKFTGVVQSYLAGHTRKEFARQIEPVQSAPAVKKASPAEGTEGTVQQTLRMFREGKTLEEIATVRGLKIWTLCSHLEEAILLGEKVDIGQFASAEEQTEIREAIRKIGPSTLTELRDFLQNRYSFEVLRLVRASQSPR